MSVQQAIDTFSILGIPVSTEEELVLIDEGLIKRSYRRLALKLHPDKNRNDPNAETKFNQLKDAHDTLVSQREAFLNLARASLQRRREMESRNEEKQRFALELEKRESAASGGHKAGKSFRARHGEMVERLQMRRQEAVHAVQLQTSSDFRAPCKYPVPDDTNMDMNYWLQYGMHEPDNVRKERQEEFSKFILEQLAL